MSITPFSNVTLKRRLQHGATLVFALITLVALSLAAVALIRSVDSGTLILGNLSFKQDAQAATDDAGRTAINWLTNNTGTTALQTDNTAAGYYASVHDKLDPTGGSTDAARVLIDWDLNDCSGTGVAAVNCLDPAATELNLMGGKVKARYLIMRLCNGTGPDSGLYCARSNPGSATTSTGGGGSCLSYPNCFQNTLTSPGVYYRILVRTKGGRDTVAYTETLVHY